MDAVFVSTLLQEIETDPNYQKYCSKISRLMRQRVRDGLLSLPQVSQELSSDWTFALRGSYARNTPNACSDVDIIVIAKSQGRNWGRHPIEHCLTGIRFNCAWYTLDRTPSKTELQICWQALDCMRFVAGAADIYSDFVSMVCDGLRTTSFQQLLQLYSAELKLFGVQPDSSVHFRDMKHGPGGQVEVEFISVLRHWQSFKSQKLNAAQKAVALALKRYSSYLSFLKEYVRHIAGVDTDNRSVLADCPSQAVPWFFSGDVSDKLALEHHDMAMIFLGLIPESQRRNGGADECRMTKA